MSSFVLVRRTLPLCLVLACGTDTSGAGDTEDASSPATAQDAGADGSAGDGSAGDGSAGDGTPADGSAGDGSSADGSGGDGSPADGSGGDGTPSPTDGPALPVPTVSCPEFTSGTLSFGARKAQIWIDEDAAAAKDGPVVFYWYGTFGNTQQASYALGNANIAKVTAAGGIVVAAEYSGTNMFPWLDGGTEDYELTDEIVGCAQQKIGIDAKHIHSFGMSAGGIFTSLLSYARANYLASVVAWSGGDSGQFAQPDGKFAALVYHGGTSDNAFGHDFVESSLIYANALKSAGHFVAVCDHGRGHMFPPNGGDQALAFFLAHGFGESEPGELPDLCTTEF